MFVFTLFCLEHSQYVLLRGRECDEHSLYTVFTHRFYIDYTGHCIAHMSNDEQKKTNGVQLEKYPQMENIIIKTKNIQEFSQCLWCQSLPYCLSLVSDCTHYFTTKSLIRDQALFSVNIKHYIRNRSFKI